MNVKSILPLLLAVVVFACSPKKAEETIAPKEFVWVSTTCDDNSSTTLLCPYSFLRLYENGIFTGGALRGYVTGNWRNDSATNQIWLVPGKITASEEVYFTVFQVQDKTPVSMDVSVIRDFENTNPIENNSMHLKAVPLQFENDPFRPDHQLWREKPVKPESPEQIKQRVKDYLLFLKMFYSFAAANKLERPDTDWFPHPMQMESPGAITMANSAELKDWYACFFSEEQAVEGYKVISGPFMKVKLKGNPDLNERNADVIDQLLQQLNGKELEKKS